MTPSKDDSCIRIDKVTIDRTELLVLLSRVESMLEEVKQLKEAVKKA